MNRPVEALTSLLQQANTDERERVRAFILRLTHDLNNSASTLRLCLFSLNRNVKNLSQRPEKLPARQEALQDIHDTMDLTRRQLSELSEKLEQLVGVGPQAEERQ